jgi:hypothetical protein
MKTEDGGDLYLTQYADKHPKHLDISNWFDTPWFNNNKVRLSGTGTVYKVPTKIIDGSSLDLVVKNCRVGEDVPLDTHTLEEFCDAEFNSPWEEFSLVEEMREGQYGPKNLKIDSQFPLAIYVPPEKMQLWQSGRSRSKIHRIRVRHPGIDLDILKQYKLVYRWIDGLNLSETFELIKIDNSDRIHYLETLDSSVMSDLEEKGYLVADTKPEHIIISESDIERIISIGKQDQQNSAKKQVEYIYSLIAEGKYAVVDYELLLRTPEHEAEVKEARRHSYLEGQTNRYTPRRVPPHLSKAEVFGVPYIFGHAESTGGRLWVVGNDPRLFDYFLPERWRKTPSIKLPGRTETFYTITKDNIRLVWETSRVGELPSRKDPYYHPLLAKNGINSPFEEFAIAHELTGLGILCAYVRAIYMTGSCKLEKSRDPRRYESHRDILDPEGNPVLQESHNYITIRGYYNGPDQWVARQTGTLYERVDLEDALEKGLIDENMCRQLSERKINRLKNVGYDGSLLRPCDLLMSIDENGGIVRDDSKLPVVVICNFQRIWKISGKPVFMKPATF